MLHVSHLSFSYRHKTVLTDISFTAGPGQCLVIAGPNGSGKSTLLSLIAGVRRPSSGSVKTDGERIGLVPQDNGIFPDMTVLENLTFFSRLAHKPLERPLSYGLEKYAFTKAQNLSGGYQKRLSIAATACARPDIWLFDEPCTSLDILWRDEIARTIVQLIASGHLVVYAGHEPEEFLSFFDAILFLDHGNSHLLTKQEIPAGMEKELIRQEIIQASDDIQTI